MKVFLMILGGLFVLGIIAVAAFFFLIMGATKPVVDAGDRFMTALKDGHYEQAYAMCATDLQTELGSVEQFQEMITSRDVQPVSWSFNSRKIDNNQGSVEGSVDFTKGHKGVVGIRFVSLNDTWKVKGFDLNWK